MLKASEPLELAMSLIFLAPHIIFRKGVWIPPPCYGRNEIVALLLTTRTTLEEYVAVFVRILLILL